MKKETKFLSELEKRLEGVNKKDKSKIVEKYKTIIDEEIKKKKSINSILKKLGTAEDVAKKEIEIIKNNKMTLSKRFNNLLNKIKKIDLKKYFKYIKDKIILLIKKIKEKFNNLKKSLSKNNKKKKENKTIVKNINKKESEIVKSNLTKSALILRIIGLILVIFLIVIFFWTATIFTASLFAILDGIKLYGINIFLFMLTLLVLWVTIIISNLIFKKKIHYKASFISLISVLLIGAFGLSLSLKELSKIENINDVSDKYSMTTHYEKFKLYNDKTKVKYITFNSEYDTNYIIEYDKKLENEFKIEIKYYECYYDYYMKNNSNNIYISLKPDLRDTISVILENLKENKIYDSDELKRYSVRIIMNKKDENRIIINN